METKTSPLVSVKVTDESKGEVEAVFATLNKVDKDKDVTRNGAFGEQDVLISQYNHASWQPGHLPIGKGHIREVGNDAVLTSQFFMDTLMGKETFAVIKHLGEKMEWSYGYDILKNSHGVWPENTPDGEKVQFLESLKVHECSPVILGAGVDTRTLSAKGAPESDNKGAIPYHETGTTDVNWDAGIMMRRCTASASSLRALCAWVDNAASPDSKSSYKFPHHMVSENGAPGAANVRACSAGIAVLNGGRGGANIPASDRQGVYAHLAHHIRDSGGTAPPLKSLDEADNDFMTGNLSLFDHAAIISYQYDVICNRIASAAAQRKENGGQLADPTLDMVKSMLASSDRLREAAANEPNDNDQINRQIIEQTFRNSHALLMLSGGYSSGDAGVD